MLNLDMVGRLRESTLDVHGVGTSPVWRPLVEEANRVPALKLRWHEGGFGPSDHNSFYVAGKPVLFVFTGVHADYHKPGDTADKIDAAGIARIADLLEGVVTGLAASGTALEFTRVAAEKEAMAAPARGARVYVGGIPDYASEGTGVAISGVSPGSPAEKAGMRGGDVIVRFGGKEIRNIYDYTYALGERKPGEVVELVVKRGGAELALQVTLGARGER
jgi:C-terminal processing protease CtpA/Prc